jgi:hypothetical protein
LKKIKVISICVLLFFFATDLPINVHVHNNTAYAQVSRTRERPLRQGNIEVPTSRHGGSGKVFGGQQKHVGKYVVHTWGYGDIVLRALAGTSMVIRSNAYHILFGIFLLVGLCLLFFSYITPSAYRGVDPLKFGRWALWITIVYAIVFNIHSRVAVEEHSPFINNQRVQLNAGIIQGSQWTEDVPWIIAYPLYVFTTIEFELGKLVENYFYDDYSYNSNFTVNTSGGGVPAVSFTGSGFMSPLIALNEMGSGNFNFNPYLYTNLNSYIIDCVMPEIISGRIPTDYLVASNDLADIIFDANSGGLVNPARVTKFIEAGSSNSNYILRNDLTDRSSSKITNVLKNNVRYNMKYLSCSDAANTLQGTVNQLSSLGNKGDIVKIILGMAGVNTSGNSSNNFLSAILNNDYSNFLGVVPQFILNYNGTASEFLTQAMIMNQFNDAYATWAAINGIPKDSLAVGLAKAQEMAKEKMSFSAVMASRYLPVIKGIIMVITIGFLPIVILMLLTPMATRFLFGYISVLLWLALWHVGSALLHSIVLFKAANYLTGLTGGNYNMLYKFAVDSNVMDYINMAGSMYWSVPTIALLVAGGFSMYTMNSLASSIANDVNAPTSSAAAETSSGNLSYGNVSANNLSGNKTNFARGMTVGSTFTNEWSNRNIYSMEDTISSRGLQSVGGVSGTGEAKINSDGSAYIEKFAAQGGHSTLSNATTDSQGKVISGHAVAGDKQGVEQLSKQLGGQDLSHLTGGNEVASIANADISNGEIIKATAYDTAGNRYESVKGEDGALHTVVFNAQGQEVAHMATKQGVNYQADLDGDGKLEIIHGASIIEMGHGVERITNGVIESANQELNGMQLKSLDVSNGQVKSGYGEKMDYAYIDGMGVTPKSIKWDGSSVKTVIETGNGEFTETKTVQGQRVIGSQVFQGVIDLGDGKVFHGEYRSDGYKSTYNGWVDDNGKIFTFIAEGDGQGHVIHNLGQAGSEKYTKDIENLLIERLQNIRSGTNFELLGASKGALSNDDIKAINSFVQHTYSDEMLPKMLQDKNMINYYANQIASGVIANMPIGLNNAYGISRDDKVSNIDQVNDKRSMSINAGGGGGLNVGGLKVNAGFDGGHVTDHGTTSQTNKSSGQSMNYNASENRAFNIMRDSIKDSLTNAVTKIENSGLAGDQAKATMQSAIINGISNGYNRIANDVNFIKNGNTVQQDTFSMPQEHGYSNVNNSFGFNPVGSFGTHNNENIDQVNTLHVTGNSITSSPASNPNNVNEYRTATPPAGGVGGSGIAQPSSNITIDNSATSNAPGIKYADNNIVGNTAQVGNNSQRVANQQEVIENNTQKSHTKLSSNNKTRHSEQEQPKPQSNSTSKPPQSSGSRKVAASGNPRSPQGERNVSGKRGGRS